MDKLNSYLDHLNEEFSIQSILKPDLLKNTYLKIKKNVKGKNINISGIKKVLKVFPVLSQDQINKILNRKIPNYKTNYELVKKHFKNKFPKEKNPDIAASLIVTANSITEKPLKETIKKADRIYSSHLGTSSAGGFFVLMILGIGLLLTSIYTSEVFNSLTTRVLVGVLGIFLIMSAIANAGG